MRWQPYCLSWASSYFSFLLAHLPCLIPFSVPCFFLSYPSSLPPSRPPQSFFFPSFSFCMILSSSTIVALLPYYFYCFSKKLSQTQLLKTIKIISQFSRSEVKHFMELKSVGLHCFQRLYMRMCLRVFSSFQRLPTVIGLWPAASNCFTPTSASSYPTFFSDSNLFTFLFTCENPVISLGLLG